MYNFLKELKLCFAEKCKSGHTDREVHMKKTKMIAFTLAAAMQLSCVSYAAGAGALVKGGDFEDGIDGFGVAYSGKNDTVMPYIFHSEHTASTGNASLRFVASKTLLSKTSTSPQSKGFAYQGIYSVDCAEVEENGEYTVSADFLAEGNGVRMHFIQMDGNRAVAASPAFVLDNGEWKTVSYKFKSEVTTDNCRIRIAFYNISKNASVYIDNFVFKTKQVDDSDWKPISGGKIDVTNNGAELTASAAEFKKYCGAYTEVDPAALPSGADKYIFRGYVTTDMPTGAVYISADNIPGTFAEYRTEPGEKIPVSLEFDPSDCTDEKIVFSVLAAADGVSGEGTLTLSDFDVYTDTQSVNAVQKGDKIYFSGKLRKGNANKAFNVRINDEPEFERAADANGEYSFTYSLSDVEKYKGINVTISEINGYEDTDGEIGGYIMAYNNTYRDSVAADADEKTTVSALRGVLTDEVLNDIGISKIRDYRLSDKDFIFNYLTGCDIPTYEKLEEEVRFGAVLYMLSKRETSLVGAIDTYGERLKLDKIKIYAEEYGRANKDALDNAFEKCTTPIKTAEDLKYVISELLLKERIEKAINNTEAMSIVGKYAENIDLDMTRYNALGSQRKNSVANGFIKYAKGVNSFKELQKKLDSLVAEAKSDNSGSGSSGGSGGSGGGGGAAGGSYSEVDISPISGSGTNNLNGGSIWKFDDLAGSEWAEQSIYALVNKNVISKSEDKKFRPNDYVTRAEFAKMIALCKGLKINQGDSVFSDVTKGDWYYGYVMALHENGVTSGISDEYFGANEYITRQDICTMLARLMNIDSDAKEADFSDMDSVADYAKAAVSYMYKNGIVSGYEDGSFRPNDRASRAEAAKLIYGIYGK